MGDTSGIAPMEEQDKWLSEALHNIKKHAFFMKKQLDHDNLKEALKYCAAMLGELRTSLLTPQKYYELYMQASAELLHLEMAFAEEAKNGKSYADLYEMVQHAGNVLPRLYLLCTVGSVYIKSKEVGAKVILKDLVEMCKGVQHPTRGLFLRSYLAQVTRDKLPDMGSAYEGEAGGDVTDAVDFVVRNFTEMNKLWVRMQHQGAMRDKERRERERQQLQDLVGKNLVLLSQLEGMDMEMYEGKVLPKIMEQIVSCKDDIAQQYLMDCMIQAFPDEFHLRTLDTLLSACPDLNVGVGIHSIMGGLMNRLAKYAKSQTEATGAGFEEVAAFEKLISATTSVSTSRTEMPKADIGNLHMSLLNFAAEVYPGNLEYVNTVLESCYGVLQPHGKVTDRLAEKQVVELLVTPLEKFGLKEVLGMAAFPRLMGLLQDATLRGLSITVCKTMLKLQTPMACVPDMEQLFLLMSQLLQDQPGGDPVEDDEDFHEEQNLVARLVHLLRAEDLDEQMAILSAARTRFMAGGPLRMRHTLRPLCFSTLGLARRIAAAEVKPKTSLQAVYKFVFQTVETIAEIPKQAEAAMHLLLQGALSASEIANIEAIAFQFMESAFELFEESVSDSKAQIVALQSIVGTLQRCYVFGQEARDTLATKAAAYSTKLLKKSDQCRALCTCAHLHWQAERPALAGISVDAEAAAPPEEEGEDGEDGAAAKGSGQPVRSGDSVLKTLKRALKTANAVQHQLSFSAKADSSEAAVALFLEILNSYLFFYADGCPEITPK
eukprot:jgi/Tetstr1/460562/TSEL_000487.t1